VHVFLYAALAWIAVDVALVVLWHYAHVVSRRGALNSLAAAAAVSRPADLMGAHHPSRSSDVAAVAPQRARTAEPVRLIDA
jgi:hypothetical protein